jgi:hypothetical protein
VTTIDSFLNAETPRFNRSPTKNVSLDAIFLSTFILTSQNHKTPLSERRNHLDLQINLLTEQENTKMRRMLEHIAEKVGAGSLSKTEPIVALWGCTIGTVFYNRTQMLRLNFASRAITEKKCTLGSTKSPCDVKRQLLLDYLAALEDLKVARREHSEILMSGSRSVALGSAQRIKEFETLSKENRARYTKHSHKHRC